MAGKKWNAFRRALLFARAWMELVWVWWSLRRHPLPEAVRRAGDVPVVRDRYIAPNRYGRVVGRALAVGPVSPRCLLRALVLFRQLKRQGDDAELVIGLPMEAVDKDAHAWVEINGHDVGPPPGRAMHEPLARYR
jgi:hypothetical protein